MVPDTESVPGALQHVSWQVRAGEGALMLRTLFMCVALLNMAGVLLFLPVVVISSRATAMTLW